MKYLAVYLAVFAVALGLLAVFEKFDIVEPLLILVLAGGGFTFVAWLLARRFPTVEGVSMRAPWWGLLAYLAFLGVVLAFGFPQNEWLKLGAKLLVFVVVPVLAFRMRLPLRFGKHDAIVTILLILVMTAFQLAVGSGARKVADANLQHTALAILASFVWMTIEAGITEEVAFRALIQTRLEELLHSRAGGIAFASIVFGLVHAPGLYLRTAGTGESFTNPTVLFAVGYSIVILSPIALFFGYLWTRTRNILVLALVHGSLDTLPNAAEVARTLGVT